MWSQMCDLYPKCSGHYLLLSLLLLNLVQGELEAKHEGQACLDSSDPEASADCGVIEQDGGPNQSHSQQQTLRNPLSQETEDDGWSGSAGQPGPSCAGRQQLSCALLPAECLSCQFNRSCVYGQLTEVPCRPLPDVLCTGSRVFNRSMVCRYCYQTPVWQYQCSKCNVMSKGRRYYRANCTVEADVLCLGRRTFHKSLFCKWTKGDRWSSALVLSVVLGGFGVDRFYLGHWQEGIGKFFSFGGLGVWTLIDVILIAIGYLGPADGSLCIS